MRRSRPSPGCTSAMRARCTATRFADPIATPPRRSRHRCSSWPGAGAMRSRRTRFRGSTASPGGRSPISAGEHRDACACATGCTARRSRRRTGPSCSTRSREALGRLSQTDREALLLRYWEELEPAQIARRWAARGQPWPSGCTVRDPAARSVRGRGRSGGRRQGTNTRAWRGRSRHERLRGHRAASARSPPRRGPPCRPLSTIVKRIEQAADEPRPSPRSRRGGLARQSRSPPWSSRPPVPEPSC